MATSTCMKCDGTRFELREPVGGVSNAEYRIFFVQCSSCGAVVGTMDYYANAGIVKRLAAIGEKLGLRF